MNKVSITVLQKKFLLIIFLLISFIIFFNKQLLSKYYSYKFSQWVEREVVFDQLKIEYPDFISVKGLKILNSNPINFKTVFEAEKVEINIDLKSVLFAELIIVNNLNIINPKFYLEIIEKNSKKIDYEKNLIKKEIMYDDNIGIAKKVNSNLSNKIWPEKKKDINFIILKSKISQGSTFIKVPSIKNFFKISMSDMKFSKIGNKKNYQHYKDVLKIILYDIYARIEDPNLKKLLKKIYNL